MHRPSNQDVDELDVDEFEFEEEREIASSIAMSTSPSCQVQGYSDLPGMAPSPNTLVDGLSALSRRASNIARPSGTTSIWDGKNTRPN